MNPYWTNPCGELYRGDVLDVLSQLPEQSVHTCITSPPYWGLRDYGTEGQIGLEKTPQEYVVKMVDVFRTVRRLLRDDGTCWVNMGDSYWGGKGSNNLRWSQGNTDRDTLSGEQHNILARPQDGKHETLKPKDLCGIPWRVAFALQDDGWYLRSDIIWNKPNPMPESVTDRPTKAHEYIFLLSKNQKYYYDAEAIKEPQSPHTLKAFKNGVIPRGPKSVNNPTNIKQGITKQAMTEGKIWQADVGGRNKRTVWTVATKPYSEAHFATFPPDLIKPCVLAGCPVQGVVLDPFMGSGTTAIVAQQNDRRWVGVELSLEYCDLAKKRITKEAGQYSQMQLI